MPKPTKSNGGRNGGRAGGYHETGMEGQEAKFEHWVGVLVAPSLDDGWECLETTP